MPSVNKNKMPNVNSSKESSERFDICLSARGTETQGVFWCMRTHKQCPFDGVNGARNVYTCDEIKEVLGGN